MLKNLENIKYTYLHRKALTYYIENNKYLSDYEREELLKRAKIHDMDKMVLYLFWDKKEASKYHREHNPHHISEFIKNGNTPTDIDILESIFDYECAALTKPDKPLNAYDTVQTHYPELIDLYAPYLKKLKLNHSYCAITLDAIDYINAFDISEENLLLEIREYLTNNKNNIYERLRDKCCSKEEYSRIFGL